MKRYLLINPPIEYPDIYEYINKRILSRDDPIIKSWRNPSCYQPIGLLKIGAALKKQGHYVKLIDCFSDTPEQADNSKLRKTFVCERECGNYKNEKINLKFYLRGLPYDEFKAKLKKEKKPDEIYVTSGLTYNNKPVQRIIEICKEVFPDIPVKLGGIYATLCHEEASKTKADSVHFGCLPEAKHEWADLDLLDYKPSYSVIKTTYGCPNKCTFCSVHVLEGNKMDFRNPEDVLNEIKDKIKRDGIRHFHFWESNILMNYKNHLEKILDGIINMELNIRIDFPEGFQLNLLNQDIANKLCKAGMTYVNLPLETSDAKLNKSFKKPSGAKDFEKALSYFLNAGLERSKIGCLVLAGLPGQTIENIIESVRYVWKCGCIPVIMSFTPIPHSEIFKKEFGSKPIKYEEWNPLLWKFASEKMKVHDLFSIAMCTSLSTPELFVSFMKDKNMIFLNKIFTEKELRYILDNI
jgi:radical SAM superfamily enzyme YgiQ (UPF0313 family)